MNDFSTKTLLVLLDGLNVDFSKILSFRSRCENEKNISKQIEFFADTVASMSSKHPDYGLAASRILIWYIHKITDKSFSNVICKMFELSMISLSLYNFVSANKTKLDALTSQMSVFDSSYNFFALKTLKKAYLFHYENNLLERPQYLLMRVACGLWAGDITNVEKTYISLSKKMYIHASPTLFNCGTNQEFLSSCFLMSVKEDSVKGLYHTITQCALISKYGGGIGLSISDVRARGSLIHSSKSSSAGIIPLLKVFNSTCRYITQGNKRKGAYAIYIEPWHADIVDFLNLKRPHGSEELRARDLFYALWIPDLFMYRVKNDLNWSLMCPKECPGLCDVWGKEFETLYESYERTGLYREKIKARKIWSYIITSQQETGTPYMLYKDSCNRMSNQNNLGTIRSSNLCAEIVEYSSSGETSVCNLASISLKSCVNSDRKFDHKRLFEIAYEITLNLNKTIDITSYATKESICSNMKHRPIAVGVQGLADVFMKMRLEYEGTEAKELNKHIFETIYFGCISASNFLAKRDGPYQSFKGSYMSKGKFQFDLWGVQPSMMWDWNSLRQSVVKYGVRNSLCTALMPTASTSQIMGNIESFEPITSNLYVRRTNAGEFVVINEYLVRHLEDLDLWNDEIKEKIIANDGSIQNIDSIPREVKAIYKTVWEMSSKTLVDMAADRYPYIDQAQSFNCYLENPTYSQLTSFHFYSFEKGLKCGMYYLRSKPASSAIKFTIRREICQETDQSCFSCNG